MPEQPNLTRRMFLGSSLLPATTASAVALRSAVADVTGATKPTATHPVTLFAFDDVSIPFRRNLRLEMHQPRKHPENPVLPHGKAREPDESRAQFYGSIIRDGGKFRMWYIAIDNQALAWLPKQAYRGCRVAYAESDDGIHWIKPKLGLVEHRGSRKNNLVLIDPPDVTGLTLVLLHEPDDPDPGQRFKMIHQIRWAEAPSFGWTTSVPLFSKDGFRWKLQTRGAPKNYAISTEHMPLPPEHTEQSGLYKWQGMYYLTGQQLSPWAYLADGRDCGRVMTTFHSADFVNWSSAKTLAYVRDGYVPKPQGQGKETHSPASVWNRGNVLLGLHGQWEGSPNVSERRMPLGLLISNDGHHFREPVPDFVFVPYGEDGEWDQRGLISGQAFEHVGDETYIWYGTWDLSAGSNHKARGAVGLLTMRLDGFGSLSLKDPAGPAQFVTCTLAGAGRLVINADGISPDARVRVELVDDQEQPLPAYAGKNAAVVTEPGVRMQVRWPRSDSVQPGDHPFRVRVNFEGPKRDQIRLYALYLQTE